MGQKPGTRNFAAPIPTDLKERIDAQVEETKIPIGVAILRLAEFWADMTAEEQKQFCYGVNTTTFSAYVRRVSQQIAEDVVERALADVEAQRGIPEGSPEEAIRSPSSTGQRAG